jgi:hypothetical protein
MRRYNIAYAEQAIAVRDDTIWPLTLGAFRRKTAKSAAPPPFAAVRDVEVAAQKRRGFARMGVRQPGAGRAGRARRGDPKRVRFYASKPLYGRLRD